MTALGIIVTCVMERWIWITDASLMRMGAEQMLWHAIDYLTWEILP